MVPIFTDLKQIRVTSPLTIGLCLVVLLRLALRINNKEPKMAKNERTSKKVASKAGKLLSSPKSSKKVKSVAASALTQAPDKKGGKGKKK